MTRAIPDQIDEIIEETRIECPDCHHPLGEPIGVEEQIQENIIPAHVHVRKYRRHRYYPNTSSRPHAFPLSYPCHGIRIKADKTMSKERRAGSCIP